MPKKKVLLVDDSQTSVFMEQMILKKGPYEIVTAADGQEGVEKALAERPDLILMDMVMPRMDGLAAVRELRSKHETKDIPIIMVTTRGEGDNVEKGYESGVNDYVTKPTDGVALLAKARLAGLEAEASALREKARSVDALVAANEALRAEGAALRADKVRFEEAVVQLRGEVAAAERRYAELERRLEESEKESHRFSQDYLHVEQQNQNLANLYVASYRLHGTVERGELMVALQEIVSNLVGSEEMGVFELGGGGEELVLAGSFGLDPERYRRIPAGRGLIGGCLRSGQTYVAGNGGEEGRGEGEENLTACIPLFLAERPLGVIAIFRLLSHKTRIEDLDRELFGLLAAQASVALYCTRLHARHGAEAARG